MYVSTEIEQVEYHIDNDGDIKLVLRKEAGGYIVVDLVTEATDPGLPGDITAGDIRTLGFFDVTNDGTESGLDADLLDGMHAAALLSRASHTDTQTSATISDFTEAVQDVVAGLLGAGSNITLNYDDAGDELTITATGGGSTDPEAVRDAIGVALIATGLMSVAVNDAADTITISTTATQNDTNAALRDRTTHTGAQAISTVTGLQTALDLKAPVASPTFTGTPSAPTPSTADSSTRLATTEHVLNKVLDQTSEFGPGDYNEWVDEGGIQVFSPLPGLVYVEHDFPISSVVDNAAETPLHTGVWTIPANEIVLNTTGWEFLLQGGLSNNTGSDKQAVFRMKSGSTTISTITWTIPTSATGRIWRWTGLIKPNDTTFPGTPIWAGGGLFSMSVPSATNDDRNVTVSAGGLNTAIANDITVTVDFDAASSNLSATLAAGIVKRLS